LFSENPTKVQVGNILMELEHLDRLLPENERVCPIFVKSISALDYMDVVDAESGQALRFATSDIQDGTSSSDSGLEATSLDNIEGQC